jgi:uncharacterized membrane protein
MNLYGLFAFLHVAAAIVWVGAAFGMLLLAMRALKTSDEADLASVMRHLIYFSRTLFMPASIVVLVAGLYMTWFAGAFLSFWILFGIVGLVASGALGSMVLGPMVKEYGSIDIAAGPTPESNALAERIVAVAKADMVILFAVVFAMVLRISWAEWLTWPILLLIVAAGVFVFMPRDLLPARPGSRPLMDDDDDDDT